MPTPKQPIRMMLREYEYSTPEVQIALAKLPNGRRGRRKYSNAILDKAAALAKEGGLAYASKHTGVHKESIRKHVWFLRVKAENADGLKIAKVSTKKAAHRKYTEERLREVIRAGLKLSSYGIIGVKAAIIREGAKRGVNGAYAAFLYWRGLISV